VNDQQKKYETEWSFSFDQIGESISKAVGSISEEAKTMTICETRGDAQSLDFHLHAVIGRTTIGAVSNPDCLIDGTLVYTGEIELISNGEAQRVVHLKQKSQNEVLAPVRKALGAISNRADLYWEVGLSPSIPTRLFVHGGVGRSKLDLTTLNLTEVRLDGGVGETKLCLPASEAGYPVRLKGGVGQNELYVPANTAIEMRIDGGVGQTTVYVAPNTAVRVTAQGGLGGVSVPREMKRTKKESDFLNQGGVWESEGFALSGRQVTIDYKGGVGAFNLVYGGEGC
jgi:hypothetical protein